MDQFDREIKRMMENHPSPFDGEQFWKGLEPELPKRRRRMILWFLLPGLLIVAFLGTSHFFNHNEYTSQENTLKRALEPGEFSQTSSTSQTTPVSKQEVVNKKDKAGKPSTVQARGRLTLIAVANSASSSEHIDKNKANSITPSFTYDDQERADGGIDMSQMRTETITESIAPIKTNESLEIHQNTKPQFEFHDPMRRLKSKSIWKWDLELVAGVARHRYSREALTQEAEQIVETENQTESAMISISYQALLRASSPSGWGGDIGIGRMSFFNKFDHTSISRVTSEVNITRTITTPNGDSTFTIKDFETEVTNRQTRQLVEHTYLNIPVGVTYQRSYKHWRFGVRAGIRFNFLTSTKGARLNLNEVQFWSDNDASPYRLDTWLSYNAGVRIERRLWERIALTLNPNIEWTSSNILKGNFDAQRGITSIGINCGLTYYLF